MNKKNCHEIGFSKNQFVARKRHNVYGNKFSKKGYTYTIENVTKKNIIHTCTSTITVPKVSEYFPNTI